MGQDIGERIKALREARELSQQDLATLAGLTQATISKLELGQRPNTSVVVLLQIATAFDMKIDDLIAGVDLPPAGPDSLATDPEFRRFMALWPRIPASVRPWLLGIARHLARLEAEADAAELEADEAEARNDDPAQAPGPVP